MKTKVSSRLIYKTGYVEKLSFWENIYIPEIIKGIKTTGIIFLKNWMNTILYLVGLRKDRGLATYYYPEELRPDYSPETRGKHVLTQNPDGTMRCVACLMCSTICPADCILIQASENFHNEEQRYPETFSIDMSRCIMCGLCVEACPKDAIRQTADVRGMATTDRRRMIYDRDHLLTWNPTVKYD